jgi:cobalt/nickel transport system permease protein
MHIPDGFLSAPVWGALDAIAVPATVWVARKARSGYGEHQGPLLGVMGAFVFAAQMINFPVGIGTSSHLVGSALLACTIGPASASIVLTAILIIQALVFQDGGILALGANVINMAVAGVLAAYLPYRLFGARRRLMSVFAGGVLSLLVSAALAISELLVSGVRIPKPLLTVQLFVFGVSALIEGAITVGIVRALNGISPEFVRTPAAERRALAAGAGLVSLLLVTFGFLIASTQPDGIWSLAGKLGIDTHATTTLLAPMADYKIRWLNHAWLSRAVAGICGLGAVFALCAAAGRLLSRRNGLSMLRSRAESQGD